MGKEHSRWTYTLGSVPAGVVVYDDGHAMTSHHDTDAGRGSHNSFDLVRLHHYGQLDTEADKALPVTERPSFKAMVALALAQPEVRRETYGVEPLPPEEDDDQLKGLQSTLPARIEPGDNRSGSAAPPSARFRVVPAPEFATLRPFDWIIKGLIPRAELMVVYGESGSGKSFLALDLAAAISRGVNWEELKTKGGRVVYICAEGVSGFRQRLRAYAKHHAIELTELPGVIPDAPNLASVDEVNLLLKALHAVGPVDLVVVDTLSATVAGANENSGEDMGRVLSHCKAMHKVTGGIVMLIHHSGKDKAKGSRGWSGIKAAADAEIEVLRVNEARTMRVSKMKDGSDGAQFAFQLVPIVLGMDEDGEAVTSCVVEVLDTMPVPADQPRLPRKGTLPAQAWEIVQPILLGGPTTVKRLVAAIIEKMIRPEGVRDQRAFKANRALDTLIASKLLFQHDGNRVSLAPVEEATYEEFDDAE